MQASAQQAFRWQWLSPRGIQAVAVTSSPSLIRVGGGAPAAHRAAAAPADGVHSPSPADAADMGLPPAATRPCANSNRCASGGAAKSKTCGAACAVAVARRRPSMARRGAIMALGSFASAAATSTLAIDEPVRRRAVASADTAWPTGPPLHSRRRQSPRTPPHAPASPSDITVATTTTATAIGLSAFGSRSLSTPAWQDVGSRPSSLLTRTQQETPPTLTRAHLRRPPSSAEAVRRVSLAATVSSATEHQPRTLPTRHIIAAVDPDLGGALAVVHWDQDPPAAADAAGEGGDGGGGGNNDAGARAAETGGRGSDGAVTAAAAASPSQQPLSTTWHMTDTGGWLLVVPSMAGGAAGRGGRQPAAAEGTDEEAEDGGHGVGDVSGGSTTAAVAPAEELRLPAPPPPPADQSRWTIRVWDMPISAAERQKRTATGAVSKRRLLHVAGARAVLASALASALPPPGERRRVTLHGYVEVPPILPGDGTLSAYTCLWSTGTWLGLLAGMGFTVGSTPVRRWKQDLGLFGARSKDAGLALARLLFPDQERILRHKKDHGRADALLIAAWALGARLPPGLAATMRRNRTTLDELLQRQPAAAGLSWGPPRPPTPTDAYGNLLTPERDMLDEIEATQSKLERLDEDRAAAMATKAAAAAAAKKKKAARGKTRPADADDGDDSAAGSVSGDASSSGNRSEAAAAVRRRPRRKGAEAAVGDDGKRQPGGGEEGEGAAAAVGGGEQRRRRRLTRTREAVEPAAAETVAVAVKTARGAPATEAEAPAAVAVAVAVASPADKKRRTRGQPSRAVAAAAVAAEPEGAAGAADAGARAAFQELEAAAPPPRRRRRQREAAGEGGDGDGGGGLGLRGGEAAAQAQAGGASEEKDAGAEVVKARRPRRRAAAAAALGDAGAESEAVAEAGPGPGGAGGDVGEGAGTAVSVPSPRRSRRRSSSAREAVADGGAQP